LGSRGRWKASLRPTWAREREKEREREIINNWHGKNTTRSVDLAHSTNNTGIL
jgi:hypothetical protein